MRGHACDERTDGWRMDGKWKIVQCSVGLETAKTHNTRMAHMVQKAHRTGKAHMAQKHIENIRHIKHKSTQNT